MAIIKCKMCGGSLAISEGMTICECEYCGMKQTVPSLDNEKKITLFSRAGRLLRACEFDKASSVFESIVADFPEEAEAYWGLVLCKYGIEYVDDPVTGKKVPTCHRSSFESVMEDVDFEQACENADVIARRQYREEAKVIENLRQSIVEISGKEEPYDIFICYKETDEKGDRTIDSVIAQDVYDTLTAKGYRVFFSRITLEDKLGEAYEPYIFAALNSAKVMLVFGTDYEFFNAVWVKNEWSRYLKLMEKDKKRHLIPCYKGIDAYDMPREFIRLQAQDLNKVGAVQDLVRGVEKLLPKQKEGTGQLNAQNMDQSNVANVTALLKRARIFLEDSNWEKADEYADRVLDMDPENADAYLMKVLSRFSLNTEKQLSKIKSEMERKAVIECNEYHRFLQYGDDVRVTEIKEYLRQAELYEEQEKTNYTIALEQSKQYQRGLISAGNKHTVGLKTNGKVVAVGDNSKKQCGVDNWCDIVAVAAGNNCTVGLKSDGRVLYAGVAGDYENLLRNNWRDIKAIDVGYGTVGGNHIVGLKEDGTVLATAERKGKETIGVCDVLGWRDIIAIAAGGYHTVGLKKDGTVIGVGKNQFDQCDFDGWHDVVSIAAGEYHTVGLKSDGTVVVAGRDSYKVRDWCDIVAIAAGRDRTVGLKSDGTVVGVGLYSECDVSKWNDIVAISAGEDHVIGLKSDGTVIATKYTGDNYRGQCEVADWKLFYTDSEKPELYQKACAAQEVGDESHLQTALNWFASIIEFKDSALRAEDCKKRYGEIIKKRKEKEQAERKVLEAKERQERKALEEKNRIERRRLLVAEKERLAIELSNTKGLFSGGKRRQLETRLSEIEAELARIMV